MIQACAVATCSNAAALGTGKHGFCDTHWTLLPQSWHDALRRSARSGGGYIHQEMVQTAAKSLQARETPA